MSASGAKSARLKPSADVARFATRPDGIAEIRTHTIRAAVAHLVAGRTAEALDAMLEGLALQAPLTFHRPHRGEPA